jgi:hypothetical protein
MADTTISLFPTTATVRKSGIGLLHFYLIRTTRPISTSASNTIRLCLVPTKNMFLSHPETNYILSLRGYETTPKVLFIFIFAF